MAQKILAIVSGITGDITLSPIDALADIVSLQGTPSADFNVFVPEGVSEWTFNNATPQRAAIRTEAGNPAHVLPQGNQKVWLDSSGNCQNFR